LQAGAADKGADSLDIRHNAKIFREKLVPWAKQRLS
jgi:hypothetical protein